MSVLLEIEMCPSEGFLRWLMQIELTTFLKSIYASRCLFPSPEN